MGDSYTGKDIVINYAIGYLNGLAEALTCCSGTEKMVDGIRGTTEIIILSMAPRIETDPSQQLH